MTLQPPDIRHLYRRIGFGALPHEVEALTGATRSEAADVVLDMSAVPGVSDMPKVSGTSLNNGRQPLTDWWMNRMTSGIAPLAERMTIFWHSHFAVTDLRVRYLELVAEHHRLLRAHAVGDFHSLCQAMAVNTAVVMDLDNGSNQAGSPQENFARELMELYTIGNGNFTEAEVVDMAKAWTGHNLTGKAGNQHYQFYSERHDNSEKTLFGITKNWDGPAAITELVEGVHRPTTARFLASKLWREFGNPVDSPTDVLEKMAAAMMSEPGLHPMKAVRAMLMHDEFWAGHNRFNLIKAPIPLLAEVVRRTGVPFEKRRVDQISDELGQRLFQPPSVAGWGHHDYWLAPNRMLNRVRIGRLQQVEVEKSGLFDGLRGMEAGAGADRILAQFGIPDASEHTRKIVKDWLDIAKRDLSEHITEREAVRVAIALPEFNLA